MIIYGWGKDLKQVGYAGIEKCANCKNYGHFWLCEHSSHASLYFIKVARWNRKLLYMCETCQRGWEVDENAGKEAIERTLALPSPEVSVEIWGSLMAAAAQAVQCHVPTPESTAFNGVVAAVIRKIDELKQRHSDEHVSYVAQRFVAFLRDADKAA